LENNCDHYYEGVCIVYKLIQRNLYYKVNWLLLEFLWINLLWWFSVKHVHSCDDGWYARACINEMFLSQIITGFSQPTSKKWMEKPTLTLSGERSPALEVVWKSSLMAEVYGSLV